MFSLIITIISIALVAALALATIYYGGSAFTQGGDAAKASQLINEGQQLQGARTLAKAQGAAHATTSDLTAGNFLAQVPADWTVAGESFQFSGATEISDGACLEVNKKAGLAATGAEVANAAAALAATDGVYECVPVGPTPASAVNTVVYKF